MFSDLSDVSGREWCGVVRVVEGLSAVFRGSGVVGLLGEVERFWGGQELSGVVRRCEW